ncbi:nitroreductase/quinone reductase family protein [Mycolicibacterium iranicum]|uniref:Nitroreductase/quinone reductase family protein n=1 Tax=Mycolicibacterium iranicum TaxID=912594 RepID=A0ABT4HK07_MYCIR|nr:nitroreductase/quinone reductase family protein [Mycolicibacterium iranicum]MCZ0730537.1 nitroreductase/quinone reductase family protein [Mycolicibacterium iranicum]
MSERYDQPGWGARIFNEAIRRLAEVGISIQGSTAVQVRGRTSGRLRGVVVNVLTVEGRRYLVSPRGNTQWARNARSAGEVEVGPRRRSRTHGVVEVPDSAKPDLLKPYLDRWYWQVKGHIGGLTPRSTREEMNRAAPSIPVFELVG